MKRAMIAVSIALASVTLALPLAGQASVKEEMRAMAGSYKGANGASDAATLKSELQTMKEHATKAKADPEFNKGPDSQVFNEGLGKLIAQIDDAIALVDAGKLPEAKTATDNLKKTRAEYHKKLGV